MAALIANTFEALAAFAQRRKRWLLGTAAAIVAYALLGFLLAPWLVRNIAIDAIGNNFNAELRIEKVAINPFVLSLRIDGLELLDAGNEPIAQIQQIYANFQLSSLFRWAWSFTEIRFDKPQFYLARDNAGALNLAALPRDNGAATEAPDPAPTTDAQASLPRLYIDDFAINDASIDWRDAVPPEPVETVLGPVSVHIAELNTLPDRAGQQEVVIATETQGTLSWSGSLQLNPLNSSGRAAIRGSHFPLLSAYVRHQSGIDITDGLADIELDYAVATAADGSLSASVSNLAVELTGLRASTFHPTPEPRRSVREFLSVPRIALTGGEMRWPGQTVRATSFEIDDASLDLVRLQDGALDFASPAPAGSESEALSDAPQNPASAASPESETAADSQASRSDAGNAAWQLALERFAINHFDVTLTDHSVSPTANVGMNEIALEMLSLSNEQGVSIPTSLSMSGMHGGTIRLDGSVVVLPQPEIDMQVSLAGLSLAAAHPYLKPLADVNLDSGTLNVTGRLQHGEEDPLLFTSDIVVANFLLTETDEGTRLGSWDELAVDGFELSLANNTLEISELRLAQPYGDILIAADGSVNLGRVSKTEPPDDGTATGDNALVDGTGSDDEPADDAGANGTDGDDELAANTASDAQAMSITIGRVTINNAAADFEDRSLPLPFAARIEAMNGNLSTISTASTEPSNVSLEGQVDEYGLVRVSGFVTPLSVADNTDLAVVFENIDVPKFSAYTVPFAGREIASGKLDLDLGYKLEDRMLAGENQIVLRDFELGEKVEHPGAASLPLGLAVALLKDPSGKINIDLPVRGDLDDPEFGYGRVIGAALMNLIVKVVASPFALLGNLVGAESDELEYINFPAGRSDLTPPEIERTQKIAEALALRPELVLEISGVIDREADGLAIRAARIDALVEAQIEAQSSGDEANYSELRAAVIEDLYQAMAAYDPPAFDALRAEHTSIVVDEENGAESERFDALAFTEALRRRLIDTESVAEAELVALARERAGIATDAVLAADPGLADRIRTIDLREEDTRSSDDSVRMRVSLATR